MLASQRRSRIAELVDLHGAVRVSDLVSELGVSDMTVRRDIDQLAERGLLERVHGGAVAVGGRTSDEPGFTAKSALMTGDSQRYVFLFVRTPTAFLPSKRISSTGSFIENWTPISQHTRAMASVTAAHPPIG